MILNQVAKMLGKSPQEIQTALSQANKIVQNMDNSATGAKNALKDNGIPTSFLDTAYSIASPLFGIASPLMSKMGTNPNQIKNDIESLKTDNFKYPKL